VLNFYQFLTKKRAFLQISYHFLRIFGNFFTKFFLPILRKPHKLTPPPTFFTQKHSCPPKNHRIFRKTSPFDSKIPAFWPKKLWSWLDLSRLATVSDSFIFFLTNCRKPPMIQISLLMMRQIVDCPVSSLILLLAWNGMYRRRNPYEAFSGR